MPDGKRLYCLGDEPYNPQNRQYAEKADWLMSSKSGTFSSTTPRI